VETPAVLIATGASGAGKRNARLCGPRGQPELATEEMDGWAAYLRGQADALDVPVLDTTAASVDEGVAALQAHVTRLRASSNRSGVEGFRRR
jgi:hypothetical protein